MTVGYFRKRLSEAFSPQGPFCEINLLKYPPLWPLIATRREKIR
jgi:hypothetical protein